MTTKNDRVTLRNIGILAHIDAGKTTTTERMLFYSGLTHKLGEVHEGTAVMDWMPQEQARGITITAAATAFAWKGSTINLIDTPGHVDFTAEVKRSLRILDGAVFVLDAKEGVEPQTEAVWRLANEMQVPRLVFINKMDCIGADFKASLEALSEKLSCRPIAITIPIGAEKSFEGVIDILTQRAIFFDGPYGESPRLDPIPGAYLDLVESQRTALIEALADIDDQIIEAVLNGDPIPVEALQGALKQATLNGLLVPVLCGAAYRNKGVQPLLDAVVAYLPSPLDKPPAQGLWQGQVLSRTCSTDEPFSGLVFKVHTDPFVGRLHYLRIYSGSLSPGQVVYNATRDKKERCQKLLHMHANVRHEIPTAACGDILALVGLKFSATGDTLCTSDAPLTFEPIAFPNPVLSIAVEPKSPADMDKFTSALERLREEDPTFMAKANEETGQLLISGMGELHLEVLIDRLQTEFGVPLLTGKPQVAYRETLLEPYLTTFDLKRQIGNAILEASMTLEVTPRERGAGHHMDLSLVSETLKSHHQEVCLETLAATLQSGALGGYPVVDVALRVLALSYKDDTHAEVALRTVASMTLNQALKNGPSTLLEPIFALTVHVPLGAVGDVVDDFQKRRGTITGMNQVGDYQEIKGTVALSQLFGYATALRSKSQGRGTHTLIFSHYDVKS